MSCCGIGTARWWHQARKLRPIGRRRSRPPICWRFSRPGGRESASCTAGPLTGRPTIGQAYPVRAGDGAVVGVLALSLDLLQLGRVFDALSLPDGSALTLVDQKGRVLARSPDGERYIGQTIAAGIAAARARRCSVGDRYRWCREVRRRRVRRSGSVGPQRWHPPHRGPRPGRAALCTEPRHQRRSGAGGPGALARAVASHEPRPAPAPLGGPAHRGRRSVAAGTVAGSESGGSRAPGGFHYDGRQPACRTRRSRSSGRAGAEDARDAPVAAAPGRPAGAARRSRSARLWRRARVEQPAAGHSWRRRAPRAPSESRRRDAGGHRDAQDAGRPGARDYPQSVAVRQPAIRRPDTRGSPRRSSRR